MNTQASTSPLSATSTDAMASSATHSASAATLPGLLQDRAARRAVRIAWKAYVADKLANPPEHTPRGPSARDLAVYCLLLGRPLTKAFSPVRSEAKLANGHSRHSALLSTLRVLDACHRGVFLHQLMHLLDVPRVNHPNERVSGGGVRLGYYTYPVQAELLRAAAVITAQSLDEAIAPNHAS